MKLKITIAAALAMLVALPVIARVSFSDVPVGHENRFDIYYAVEQGWFTGYDDGTFQPDEVITPAQMTKVFTRAYPDGISRGGMATFIRTGQDGDVPTSENTGKIYKAPDVPIIRIQNMEGHTYLDGTRPVEILDICHINHEYDNYPGSPFNNLTNLSNYCKNKADVYTATVVYWPSDLDINWESVFIHLDNDPDRIKLQYTGNRRYFTPRFAEYQGSEIVKDDIKILGVRNVPNSIKVDVMIECRKYEGWTGNEVDSYLDIPYEDCYPQ